MTTSTRRRRRLSWSSSSATARRGRRQISTTKEYGKSFNAQKLSGFILLLQLSTVVRMQRDRPPAKAILKIEFRNYSFEGINCACPPKHMYDFSY
jgi:hypothetical protein